MVVIPFEACVLDKTALIVEASSAGLPPGQWPDFVSVLNPKGEGILFGPSWHTIPGDGGRVYYSQGARFQLHLLND